MADFSYSRSKDNSRSADAGSLARRRQQTLARLRRWAYLLDDAVRIPVLVLRVGRRGVWLRIAATIVADLVLEVLPLLAHWLDGQTGGEAGRPWPAPLFALASLGAPALAAACLRFALATH